MTTLIEFITRGVKIMARKLHKKSNSFKPKLKAKTAQQIIKKTTKTQKKADTSKKGGMRNKQSQQLMKI